MLGVARAGPLGPLTLSMAGASVKVGSAARESAAGTLRGTAAHEDRAGLSSSHPAGDPPGRSPRRRSPLGEREAWAVLAAVEGIGPVSFASLIRRFGSATNILDVASHGPAAIRDLPPDPEPQAAERPRIDDTLLGRLVEAARHPEPVLAAISSAGLAIVTLEDDSYPPALRETELAPPVLFVLGDLEAVTSWPSVAVVGTRRPTEGGRRVGARIAGAIARSGAAVVSGLAIGIDGVAHEAALAERGRTVAVLGAGHRHVTPAAHRGLARRIVDAGGAIVSEFPPAIEPSRWSFPRRNRIISGATSATVVVEAAIRSGALITAAWALEQGRECFLVPGSLDDTAARGCLRFLRDHAGLARIVAGIPELLEDLGLADASTGAVVPALGEVGDLAQRIAGVVAAGRGTVDEIALAVDVPAAAVLGALTVLELHGLVVAGIGRYRPAGLLATRTGRSARTSR